MDKVPPRRKLFGVFVLQDLLFQYHDEVLLVWNV